MAASIGGILMQSQHNNRAVGVTGRLYTDGDRFLQVLEGEKAAVAATFARIKADPRHHAVVTLSDRTIAAREFGDWAMAHAATDAGTAGFDARLDKMLAGASASVRGTFLGLVAARRAA